MITTTDELRDYLVMLDKAEGPPDPGKAERLLGPLVETFASWDTKLLGDLMLSVGMMLAVGRGTEGPEALADTLNQMLVILQCRQELWGNVN